MALYCDSQSGCASISSISFVQNPEKCNWTSEKPAWQETQQQCNHNGTSSSISYSLFLHPSLFPLLIPLCTFITPSLIHSRLTTYLFHKSYSPPRSFTCFSQTASTAWGPGPFLLSYSVFIFIFLIFSFLCRALDEAGHLVSFWAHVNLSYRNVCIQWRCERFTGTCCYPFHGLALLLGLRPFLQVLDQLSWLCFLAWIQLAITRYETYRMSSLYYKE